LEGLHLVTNLCPNQIKVHPAVVAFYKSIETKNIELEKKVVDI